MTLGLGRFEYYLIQLDDKLLAASKTDNAAKYLYEHDARTTCFMLEGLCKLYAALHNHKTFTTLKQRFKVIEDTLGAVDYYDNFAKQFLINPEVPSTIRMYLEEQKNAHLIQLNIVLLKKKWINHDPLRTKKIRKKLRSVNWKQPVDEINLFEKLYTKSINEINEFYTNTGDSFTNIELQVHDLRRRLRWLSIYPQALQGAMQLADNVAIVDKNVQKYLTDAVIHSPYNVFPKQGNNPVVMLLNKNYFLALSNVISSLGKLKDDGLKLLATTEALQATQFLKADAALQRACTIHSVPNNELDNIMIDAKHICEDFFAEKNLEKILGKNME